MDLLNFGILNDTKASGGRFTSSAFPVAVFGTESFLFMQMNSEGEKMIPVLYQRAEDLDVSSIRSITIAYAEPLVAEYSAAILDFNRTHHLQYPSRSRRYCWRRSFGFSCRNGIDRGMRRKNPVLCRNPACGT